MQNFNNTNINKSKMKNSISVCNEIHIIKIHSDFLNILRKKRNKRPKNRKNTGFLFIYYKIHKKIYPLLLVIKSILIDDRKAFKAESSKQFFIFCRDYLNRLHFIELYKILIIFAIKQTYLENSISDIKKTKQETILFAFDIIKGIAIKRILDVDAPYSKQKILDLFSGYFNCNKSMLIYYCNLSLFYDSILFRNLGKKRLNLLIRYAKNYSYIFLKKVVSLTKFLREYDFNHSTCSSLLNCGKEFFVTSQEFNYIILKENGIIDESQIFLSNYETKQLTRNEARQLVINYLYYLYLNNI